MSRFLTTRWRARVVSCAFFGIVFFILEADQAESLPSFARENSFPCVSCHAQSNSIPRASGAPGMGLSQEAARFAKSSSEEGLLSPVNSMIETLRRRGITVSAGIKRDEPKDTPRFFRTEAPDEDPNKGKAVSIWYRLGYKTKTRLIKAYVSFFGDGVASPSPDGSEDSEPTRFGFDAGIDSSLLNHPVNLRAIYQTDMRIEKTRDLYLLGREDDNAKSTSISAAALFGATESLDLSATYKSYFDSSPTGGAINSVEREASIGAIFKLSELATISSWYRARESDSTGADQVSRDEALTLLFISSF